MNYNDYTLKVVYKYNGREYTAYENDERISFSVSAANDSLKITAISNAPVDIISAELIYDRYYESDERFFANGYQSWTTSREYSRGDVQRGLHPLSKLPFARAYSASTGDYDFALYGKDLYHSFTYTYIRKGNVVNLIGSLDERTGYTLFYADMRENLFVISKDLEGLTLDGECNMFDLVYFDGKYDEVFDRYFGAYPMKHTGRVDHLAGYTSWYNYFQDIDEEIILRDLEGIKRAGDSAGIFQIDDGYETMIGDWDVDVKKFPKGMKFIADKVHAQGLLAGLWIAPFSAQYKANIVKEHPEWLLRNAKGKKVVGGIAWGGFWVLDIELPEVRAYIKRYFDKVFGEWGFDMVKLDFLYSCCIIPRNGKTRGRLMCEAMDFLRECCGDKLILGCGVPLGPAFGIVDACRISCDVELSFKDRFYAKCTNQEVVSARNAMNNTVFRRHLDGRIFANDPDVFFLRDDGARKAVYTEEQKRLLAKINNMFGSVLFVSDDIGAYSDEHLKVLIDSYKRFDGKVLKASFANSDTMKIIYEKDGVKYKLKYNVYTGVCSEKVM